MKRDIERWSRTRQKLAVIDEAARAGLGLVKVTDLGSDVGAPSVRATAVALFGAAMSSTFTQVFRFERAGTQHLYVQPSEGMHAMPGEHHVWLPGALRSAAGLVEARPSFADFTPRTGPSRAWFAGDDVTVATYLDGDPALRAAIHDARWEWRLGLGQFRYAWNLQLRPLAGGSTHLAMMATGTGALSGRAVGFAQLASIAQPLARLLGHISVPSTPPLLQPSAFSSVFEEVLASPRLFDTIPPPDGPLDFGRHVHALLASRASARLKVAPVPAAKDVAARVHVLPLGASHLPIVATVDLTVMGSSRDALVLTPTHVFYRKDDDRLSFAYTELREILPRAGGEDVITLRLSRLGEISLDLGASAGALHALFSSFVRRTAPAPRAPPRTLHL